MDSGSAARLAFGPFELDTTGPTLLRDGQPVSVKPKVLDLLAVLARAQGRLVTKDQLMDALWPSQFVEEANLTQSVYELRRALGDRRSEPAYIENVPRRGYRFKASVRVLPPDRADASPGSEGLSIAVVPFRPMSTTSADESLEHGLAETLTTALSSIPGLSVRRTGTIGQQRESTSDPIDLGRRLRVRAVLEGAVQRSGDRLRVTSRLTRVDDEVVLWAGKFDEAFTDIFSVQDSICDRVVASLAIELPAGASVGLVKRHTGDPEVHRLFLECRHHWHRWTPEGWKRSIECGRQAIERDPTHAPSHSWMAASHVALGIVGVVRPREAFREAKELVARALLLDEALAEAHEVRGAIALFHDWKWGEGLRSLERAIELDPGNAGARDLYALLMVVTGRTDAALREAARARETDPLSLLINTDVGKIHYYARRNGEAIDQLRHTLRLDPWFAHARFALGHALVQEGRHEEAVEAMESAVEHSGRDRESSADLAYALAAAGAGEESKRILAALTERSRDSWVDPFFPALVCVGLDEREEAFAWLARALEERSRELVYLRADPIFDHLHTDSRFADLTMRIGI